MATQPICPDDPATNWKNKVCVTPTSKNMKGKLVLFEKREEKCEKPECVTFKTRHSISLKLTSHQPCESKVGKLLNNATIGGSLITVFHRDGQGRGFHTANISSSGTNIKGIGRISGMTNVGTHRKPVFDDCQPCDARGVMEGRICIKIGSNDPELKGCQLFGTYRIRFDPAPTGISSALEGVLEGVIICPCK
jgi:hypothetical protein